MTSIKIRLNLLLYSYLRISRIYFLLTNCATSDTFRCSISECLLHLSDLNTLKAPNLTIFKPSSNCRNAVLVSAVAFGINLKNNMIIVNVTNAYLFFECYLFIDS